MKFLRLTEAKDGSTVYVNADEIVALCRRPAGEYFDKVHTQVGAGRLAIYVIESVADIIAMMGAEVVNQLTPDAPAVAAAAPAP